MTELTDSDRAAIERVRKKWRRTTSGYPIGDALDDLDKAIWCAGKAAGIAEGLEMAITACNDELVSDDTGFREDIGYNAGIRDCIEALRALKASA